MIIGVLLYRCRVNELDKSEFFQEMGLLQALQIMIVFNLIFRCIGSELLIFHS